MMADTDDPLDRIIAACLAPGSIPEGPARLLSAEEIPVRLELVLDAVFETVLPRRLCFASPTGISVTLDVAHRHILAAETVRPGEGPAARQTSVRDSPDLLGTLMSLVASGPVITLTWTRLAFPGSRDHPGLAVSDLRACIPNGRSVAGSGDDAARARAGIPGHPPRAALCIHHGLVTHAEGHDGDRAELADQADRLLRALPPSLPQGQQVIILTAADRTIVLDQRPELQVNMMFDGQIGHALARELCEPDSASRPQEVRTRPES
jgi:hypothetical protein